MNDVTSHYTAEIHTGAPGTYPHATVRGHIGGVCYSLDRWPPAVGDDRELRQLADDVAQRAAALIRQAVFAALKSKLESLPHAPGNDRPAAIDLAGGPEGP